MNSNNQAIKPISLINTINGAPSSTSQPIPPEVEPPPDPAQVADQQMKAERQLLQNTKLKDDLVVRRMEQIEKRRGGSGRLERLMTGLDTLKSTAHKLRLRNKIAAAPEPGTVTRSFMVPQSFTGDDAAKLGNPITPIRDIVDTAKDFPAHFNAYVADPRGESQGLKNTIFGGNGDYRNAGNKTWNFFDQQAKKWEPGSLGSGIAHLGGSIFGNLAKGGGYAREAAGNFLVNGVTAPATELARGALNTAYHGAVGVAAGAYDLLQNGLNTKWSPVYDQALSGAWQGIKDTATGAGNLAMMAHPLTAAVSGYMNGVSPTNQAGAEAAAAAAPPVADAAATPEAGPSILASLAPLLGNVQSMLSSIMGGGIGGGQSTQVADAAAQGPLSTSFNHLLYGPGPSPRYT